MYPFSSMDIFGKKIGNSTKFSENSAIHSYFGLGFLVWEKQSCSLFGFWIRYLLMGGFLGLQRFLLMKVICLCMPWFEGWSMSL